MPLLDDTIVVSSSTARSSKIPKYIAPDGSFLDGGQVALMKDCKKADEAYEIFVAKRQALFHLLCPPPGCASWSRFKTHTRSEEALVASCPRLLVACILQTHEADIVQAKALAYKALVSLQKTAPSVPAVISRLAGPLTRKIEAAHGQTLQVSQLAA
jgi:hypothetical protein